MCVAPNHLSPLPPWEINRFFFVYQGKADLRLKWEAKHSLFNIAAVILVVPTGFLSAITHPWQFSWAVSTELGQIPRCKCRQCFQYTNTAEGRESPSLTAEREAGGQLKGEPGKVGSKTFSYKM